VQPRGQPGPGDEKSRVLCRDAAPRRPELGGSRLLCGLFRPAGPHRRRTCLRPAGLLPAAVRCVSGKGQGGGAASRQHGPAAGPGGRRHTGAAGAIKSKGDDRALEIDLVFKIAAIGIIVAVLNQLLIRSGREDQAMMTTLAGLVVVLSMLVQQISDLFVTIKSLFAL